MVVASRGGDTDPEAALCVGSSAVTSKLLPQLRSLNALKLTILLPYGTPEEVEARTDGISALSPVNSCRFFVFS
jgi:hypothetical protein